MSETENKVNAAASFDALMGSMGVKAPESASKASTTSPKADDTKASETPAKPASEVAKERTDNYKVDTDIFGPVETNDQDDVTLPWPDETETKKEANQTANPATDIWATTAPKADVSDSFDTPAQSNAGATVWGGTPAKPTEEKNSATVWGGPTKPANDYQSQPAQEAKSAKVWGGPAEPKKSEKATVWNPAAPTKAETAPKKESPKAAPTPATPKSTPTSSQKISVSVDLDERFATLLNDEQLAAVKLQAENALINAVKEQISASIDKSFLK